METLKEINKGTLLNGIVDPTTEGNNGDFYINTVANKIFGPKTAGNWGVGKLLGSDDSVAGDLYLFYNY